MHTLGYHFYLGQNGSEDSENADASSGVTSIASTTEVLPITNSSTKIQQHNHQQTRQPLSKNSPAKKYQYDETSPLGQNGPYPLYQGYGRELTENAE